MSYSRRSFLRDSSLTAILITTGGFKALSADEFASTGSKVKLRFVLASDAHYGQPDTPFDAHIDQIVQSINEYHQQNPMLACFINGDIIHNEPTMLAKAKTHLDQLKMPYYTGKGNHDMVSDAFWKDVWGTMPNHTVVHKKQALSSLILPMKRRISESGFGLVKNAIGCECQTGTSISGSAYSHKKNGPRTLLKILIF